MQYTLVQKKELTVSEEDLEAQIQAVGNAFAIDMLAAKFIQGLPVVGAFGGLSNPVCWKQVMKMCIRDRSKENAGHGQGGRRV